MLPCFFRRTQAADVDQFYPILMFGFQFNPKDAGVKQPWNRKMQRAVSNHTTARE
jgi:hypothetical protein